MSKRFGTKFVAAGLATAFLAGVWVGSATRLSPESSPATSSAHLDVQCPGFDRSVDNRCVNNDAFTRTRLIRRSYDDQKGLLPTGWSGATVVAVVDGDTIDVRLDDGTVERLRLIGTNSPENGECYSAQASKGLSDLVLGNDVRLEEDVSDRDQFGRLLRYVFTADDRFVNEITVEAGWAIARKYPPDVRRSDQLESAQVRAMQSLAEHWAPNACGPAVSGKLQIAYVEYDSPGEDSLNLNGEWVEITNAADSVVDLSGWILKDESASHRYPFPDGFELQPGATVQVFSGCGQNSAAGPLLVQLGQRYLEQHWRHGLPS